MFRLGGKLILGVLLTLGTILSVGFYFVLDQQTRGMLDEVRANANSISKVVSSGLGELLSEIELQHSNLQREVQRLAGTENIASIIVFDEDLRIIANSDSQHDILLPPGEKSLAVQDVAYHGTTRNLVNSQGQLYGQAFPIVEEVTGQGEVIAIILLTLDSVTTNEQALAVTSQNITDETAWILRRAHDKQHSLNSLVSQIRGILEVMQLDVYSRDVELLHGYGAWVELDGLIESIDQVFATALPIEMDNLSAEYYQRLTPIFSADDSQQVIGVVRLVMSMEHALEKIDNLSNKMRIIALIVAVAILLVLWSLMQRVIIQPIRTLSDSAQRLGKGEFHMVDVPDSTDELAQLGKSFNSMVEAISDYQHRLIDAKEYNENILRTMSDALIVLSNDGRIEHVNDATVKLLGYQHHSDLEGFPLSLICSDEPYSHGGCQLSFLLEASDFDDQEKYLITRSGQYIPVLLSFSVIHDIQGREFGAVCVARDITERKRAQEKLKAAYDDLEQRVKHRTEELFQEKERLQVTLRSLGEAVVTADYRGRVEYLNPVAERILGCSCSDMQGHLLEEVLPLYDDLGEPMDSTPLYQCLHEGYCDLLSMNHSMNLLNHHNQMVAIESTMAPMLDNRGVVTGVVVVFRDVSEERQLRKQLLHQASHDALTGLSNRLVFEKRLGEALQKARKEKVENAVLFLDLDQFKVVNDTCGHVAGDALLQQLTTLLRERMRASDILARLGGDEFGVILNNCSLDHAKKVALILLDTVREFRFIWEDKSFEVGVSIGLVMLDEASESVASVMSAADIACYAAKDGGRNRYHIYEASDKELKNRHGEMQWVTLITKAIEEDRFVLYVQEIADLNLNNSAKHYEVLIRMIGESGEMIPPGAFLPAAERYGLITNMDRWVIDNGLRAFAEYIEKHPQQEIMFAINLSGISLGDEEFLKYIIDKIHQYKLPHHCLCFEITETAAVANLTQASKFIKALRSLGCKFALDDFGCGVSSFSYLKNLPVDYLKIDGMFVRDMVDDAIDYAMVEAINHIGQVMGLQTIAEFVEGQAILDCLVALEVDYAQGYFVAEPMPLAEI